MCRKKNQNTNKEFAQHFFYRR